MTDLLLASKQKPRLTTGINERFGSPQELSMSLLSSPRVSLAYGSASSDPTGLSYPCLSFRRYLPQYELRGDEGKRPCRTLLEEARPHRNRLAVDGCHVE